MSLCTISSAGHPVVFFIKHTKYKNKNPDNKTVPRLSVAGRLLTITFDADQKYVNG